MAFFEENDCDNPDKEIDDYLDALNEINEYQFTFDNNQIKFNNKPCNTNKVWKQLESRAMAIEYNDFLNYIEQSGIDNIDKIQDEYKILFHLSKSKINLDSFQVETNVKLQDIINEYTENQENLYQELTIDNLSKHRETLKNFQQMVFYIIPLDYHKTQEDLVFNFSDNDKDSQNQETKLDQQVDITKNTTDINSNKSQQELPSESNLDYIQELPDNLETNINDFLEKNNLPGCVFSLKDGKYIVTGKLPGLVLTVPISNLNIGEPNLPKYFQQDCNISNNKDMLDVLLELTIEAYENTIPSNSRFEANLPSNYSESETQSGSESVSELGYSSDSKSGDSSGGSLDRESGNRSKGKNGDSSDSESGNKLSIFESLEIATNNS